MAQPFAAFRDIRLNPQLLLLLAVPLLLIQTFIPIENFIHRGDDAFYYFNVAINYHLFGHWTYDGINSTNGVQPLWAMILTAVAKLGYWVGIREPDTFARLFVALTTCLHLGSLSILLHLFQRKISLLAGIITVGAFVFPLGIVWSRLWGMESSLYAFTLVSTIAYYHLSFQNRPTIKSAITLGILLALTALSLLNAGLLIAILLSHYLVLGHQPGFTHRLKLVLVAGITSSALIIPYGIWNYLTTGHIGPISGAVKAVTVQQLLESWNVQSVWSIDFLKNVYWHHLHALEWFVTARMSDALWPIGARNIVGLGGSPTLAVLAMVFVACLLGPALFGHPKEWSRYLARDLKALWGFNYVLIFGLCDAVASIMIYPNQIGYAMVRWWWVENEIIIVAITSVFLASALSYCGQQLLNVQLRKAVLVCVWLIALAVSLLHSLNYYWTVPSKNYDWRLSWNDAAYNAALWLNQNVPESAIVGSWNAGVIGYYSKQPVINLDGLINNFELLPYIAENRIDQYILNKKIDYIADIKPTLDLHLADKSLSVTEVYRAHNSFMGQPYIIYKVNDESPQGAE